MVVGTSISRDQPLPHPSSSPLSVHLPLDGTAPTFLVAGMICGCIGMRLLDTVSGQFVEVTDSGTVEYAIFSHTWDSRGEQSYQELRGIQEDYRPEAEVEVPHPPFSSTSAAFSSARSSPAPPSSLHEDVAEPQLHVLHFPVEEKTVEAAEHTPLVPATKKRSMLARKCRAVLRPLVRLIMKATTIARRPSRGALSRPITATHPAGEEQIWTSGPIVASPEPSTVRSASTSHAHDDAHTPERMRIANSPFQHWAPRYYASPITPPPNPVVLEPYPIFDSPTTSPATTAPRIRHAESNQGDLDRYPSIPRSGQTTARQPSTSLIQHSTYPVPTTLAQYPVRADRSRNPPPQAHTPTATPQTTPRRSVSSKRTAAPTAKTPYQRIYGATPSVESEHEPKNQSWRSHTPSRNNSRTRRSSPAHSLPHTPAKATRRPSQRRNPALAELPTPPATPPRANWFWDDPRISEKIRRACAVARAHGHRLLWLDFCCIDRTSSAELSEAVNSMFRWYRDASVCYVYLPDVLPSGAQSDEGGDGDDEEAADSVVAASRDGQEGREDPRGPNSAFRHSRWFRRGWTLQELIAPRVVVFLSLDWHFLGTKASLGKVIEAVTSIDRRILSHRMRFDEASVAQRMSWAAERRTTRVEDEAYSLLGIFNVNMPILYGEGHRAFVRLQEEIVKRIPDQSLFTWGDARFLPTSALDARRTPDSAKTAASPSPSCRIRFESVSAGGATGTLFADSPQRFGDAWTVRPLSHEQFVRRLGLPSGADSPSSQVAPWDHATTPYGVRTQIPLIPVSKVIPRNALSPPSKSYSNMYFALLACEPASRAGHVMAVVCTVERARTGGGLTIVTGGTWSALESIPSSSKQQRSACRVTALSPELLARCRAHLLTEMLFLPLEDPRHLRVARPIWKQTEIRLAGWSLEILRELGYIVEGGRVRARSYRYTLAKDDDVIAIEFEYRDASEWSTEISVVVTPLPGHGAASARRRSPLLGSRTPVPSPPQRLRMGDYDDPKECRVRLSSGLYLALVFKVHRSSSVLGYLDVQILGEGSRESAYTTTTTSSGAGTSTLATSTGRSRSDASTSVSVSVGAVASARIVPARVDELDELEDDEPGEVPELDLEAEGQEEEEEEMPSPAVSASSFQFLEEAEGRLAVAQTR